MWKSICTGSLLLLSTSFLSANAVAQDDQLRLTAPTRHHEVDPAILAALKKYPDPVDALVALHPETAGQLAQPRLLHVVGEPSAEWMTEGDKLRLKRKGKKFIDITDHEDFYKKQVNALAGEAHLPKLSHQNIVKRLFPHISTKRMYDVLEHMTSYYTRYFGSVTGERSAQWLHDHIAEIIKNAPFHTHISLEYFTHGYPQPSVIARFETKFRNASQPLTILGAHLDSMNYVFPLLPAPGADDDCSGTVSNLEAFRVLAESGFIPLNGPVEFTWFAGEEGGLVGSQDIARYKKESGARIGAMMEFDMTAFVARNSTESIAFIETEADPPLTKWAANLAKEYLSIPVNTYTLPSGAGSDYMSYTMFGYPTAMATEGDPTAGDGFLGDYNPYIHTEKDTMDLNDETGVFSIEHMARFSELAIAFVVEQAGWDNKWR